MPEDTLPYGNDSAETVPFLVHPPRDDDQMSFASTLSLGSTWRVFPEQNSQDLRGVEVDAEKPMSSTTASPSVDVESSQDPWLGVNLLGKLEAMSLDEMEAATKSEAEKMPDKMAAELEMTEEGKILEEEEEEEPKEEKAVDEKMPDKMATKIEMTEEKTTEKMETKVETSEKIAQKMETKVEMTEEGTLEKMETEVVMMQELPEKVDLDSKVEKTEEETILKTAEEKIPETEQAKPGEEQQDAAEKEEKVAAEQAAEANQSVEEKNAAADLRSKAWAQMTAKVEAARAASLGESEKAEPLTRREQLQLRKEGGGRGRGRGRGHEKKAAAKPKAKAKAKGKAKAKAKAKAKSRGKSLEEGSEDSDDKCEDAKTVKKKPLKRRGKQQEGGAKAETAKKGRNKLTLDQEVDEPQRESRGRGAGRGRGRGRGGPGSSTPDPAEHLWQIDADLLPKLVKELEKQWGSEEPRLTAADFQLPALEHCQLSVYWTRPRPAVGIKTKTNNTARGFEFAYLSFSQADSFNIGLAVKVGLNFAWASRRFPSPLQYLIY